MVRGRFLHRGTSSRILIWTVLALFLMSGTIASADIGDNSGSWRADSDGTSVHVEISLVTNSQRFLDSIANISSNPSYSECEFRLVEIPLWYDALEAIGEPPTMEAVPYYLYCGTAIVDSFWINPQDAVDYDAIAWAEANRYVEEVLAPHLGIESNPTAYAITGVPSWFWINGWNGIDLNTVVSAPFGATVNVTLRLIDVEWNFGDNTNPTSGDLGLAYPNESPIKHNYEVRSTSKANPDGAYQVTATVNIAPSYRLNGGGEIPLNPNLTVNLQVPQIVRQLQAVLVQN